MNSAWWEANLSTEADKARKQKREFFFYFEPLITYQVFNATLQGGLFTNQTGRYTTKSQPLVYSHRFGVVCAQSRWMLQAGYTYKTREAVTMQANENYGTLALAYRFH